MTLEEKLRDAKTSSSSRWIFADQTMPPEERRREMEKNAREAAMKPIPYSEYRHRGERAVDEAFERAHTPYRG